MNRPSVNWFNLANNISEGKTNEICHKQLSCRWEIAWHSVTVKNSSKLNRYRMTADNARRRTFRAATVSEVSTVSQWSNYYLKVFRRDEVSGERRAYERI